MTQNTRLTADESADFMRLALKAQIPFFFTKYGDGAIECINGLGSRTCDREIYSKQLGDELERTWENLKACPSLYLADWLSTHFDAVGTGRHENLYMQFVDACFPVWLHYDALLIDRETKALYDFYATLKADRRVKWILGPAEWAPALRMLGASHHIVTPQSSGGILPYLGAIREQLDSAEFDILVYGAGMAGTIPVADHWREIGDGACTYINLGSALDPLFRGKSRKRQLEPRRAQNFFRRLL